LGPPKAGPDGRAMERSEFARSSRKFRVRGLSASLSLGMPSPSVNAPLWRGSLNPTLSPQAGRGSRKTRSHHYLSADRDEPAHDGEQLVQHDRNAH
jgi:hypothetical protein